MRRALCLLAALLLTASACGEGGESPQEVLAKAATETRDAGSSRVEFNASFEGLPEGQQFSFSGAGEFDYEAQKGTASFSFEGVPAAAGDLDIEMIQDGLVIYMKAPFLSENLPGNREWLRLDLEEAGALSGVDVGAFQQLNQSDPTQYLAYMRAVSDDVEEAGSEQVRGVDTTRYEGTVDLEKVAESAPADLRDRVEASVEGLKAQLGGDTTFPISVWIDDDGLLRRVRQTITTSPPGAGNEVTFAFGMELFDFGVEVDVAPPPERDTVDFSDAFGGR